MMMFKTSSRAKSPDGGGEEESDDEWVGAVWRIERHQKDEESVPVLQGGGGPPRAGSPGSGEPVTRAMSPRSARIGITVLDATNATAFQEKLEELENLGKESYTILEAKGLDSTSARANGRS